MVSWQSFHVVNGDRVLRKTVYLPLFGMFNDSHLL